MHRAKVSAQKNFLSTDYIFLRYRPVEKSRFFPNKELIFPKKGKQAKKNFQVRYWKSFDESQLIATLNATYPSRFFRHPTLLTSLNRLTTN